MQIFLNTTRHDTNTQSRKPQQTITNSPNKTHDFIPFKLVFGNTSNNSPEGHTKKNLLRNKLEILTIVFPTIKKWHAKEQTLKNGSKS